MPLPAGYTYLGPPRITSITPPQGSAVGGNTVTIRGTNFGSSTQVNIGGKPSTNVSVVSLTELTADTPSGTANAQVDVVVTTIISSFTLSNGYKYIP